MALFILPSKLGIMPLYRALSPSSLVMVLVAWMMPLYLASEGWTCWTVSLVLSKSVGYSSTVAIKVLPDEAIIQLVPLSCSGQWGWACEIWWKMYGWKLIYFTLTCNASIKWQEQSSRSGGQASDHVKSHPWWKCTLWPTDTYVGY